MELEKQELNITVDMLRNFENNLKNFEQVEMKTTHRFLDGMYAREVFMPKGSIVTSKTHKLENLTIISQGHMIELTENDNVREIIAPFTMISPPGMKRALYMVEDTTWTTVHNNPDNERDLSKLEERIIAPEPSCSSDSEDLSCLG